jgi:restriction endonuclease S subunit
VVRVLKEQVDPASGEVDRYVAGEHMETENVHIRKWGTVGDGYLGPAFIRRFRKGQVLYGSRRTYLKKVAVAEWDGVTSNTTMVLEAVEGKLLQELLPWLMLSDRFTRHSVAESKGSTNPYINWPDIAKFEFDLPPLVQQQRIAKVLWAIDEAMEASHAHFEKLSAFKVQSFGVRTRFGLKKYPVRSLDDVSITQYGLSCALSEAGEYPILRMMNYDEELVAATDLKFADMLSEVAAQYRLQKGDILFNRTNSAELVGKVGIFELEGCYLFASYLVRIQTDRRVLLPEFLNFFLNSDFGQASVRAFATPGVSQSNISAGSLKRLMVPVPTLKDQLEVVKELRVIAESKRAVKGHIDSQRRMLLESLSALTG